MMNAMHFVWSGLQFVNNGYSHLCNSFEKYFFIHLDSEREPDRPECIAFTINFDNIYYCIGILKINLLLYCSRKFRKILYIENMSLVWYLKKVSASPSLNVMKFPVPFLCEFTFQPNYFSIARLLLGSLLNR